MKPQLFMHIACLVQCQLRITQLHSIWCHIGSTGHELYICQVTPSCHASTYKSIKWLWYLYAVVFGGEVFMMLMKYANMVKVKTDYLKGRAGLWVRLFHSCICCTEGSEKPCIKIKVSVWALWGQRHRKEDQEFLGSWLWWPTPVIPASGKLRPRTCTFEGLLLKLELAYLTKLPG